MDDNDFKRTSGGVDEIDAALNVFSELAVNEDENELVKAVGNDSPAVFPTPIQPKTEEKQDNITEELKTEGAASNNAEEPTEAAVAAVADAPKVRSEDDYFDGKIEEKLTLPEFKAGQKPVTKKEKSKKWISTLIFVAFNIIAIGVVLWLELKSEKEGFVGAAEVGNIIGANAGFLLLGFVMYFVHVLCDAFGYFALIKQCGYGYRFGLALRVAVLGKYYDNITPWSTGGQPFQMVYMAKANIDTPTACTLPIIKYAIRIFFVDAVIITLFAMSGVKVNLVVQIGAYMGIFFSTILPLLLILFSRNVPLLLRVTKWAVGVGRKMKLVKDYDKAVAKAQDTMDSFLAAFKYLGLHKAMIVVVGVLSVVDCIAIGSLPYFIVRTLGGNGNFLEIMAKTYYVTLSSGIIPTPGSSGASEGSFYSVFDTTVPGGSIFWAVLLWRVLIFYMPIILGVCMQLLEWIIGRGKVKLVKQEISWIGKKTINVPKKQR